MPGRFDRPRSVLGGHLAEMYGNWPMASCYVVHCLQYRFVTQRSESMFFHICYNFSFFIVSLFFAVFIFLQSVTIKLKSNCHFYITALCMFESRYMSYVLLCTLLYAKWYHHHEVPPAQPKNCAWYFPQNNYLRVTIIIIYRYIFL